MGEEIDKETLMKLITQQMINALLAGDDEEEDEEAIISALQKKMRDRERARNVVKKKSRRRRLDQSDLPPMMPPTPTECLRPGDDFVIGIKGDDSFAGNDLHELVDASHRRSWLTSSGRSGGSTEDVTKTSGMSSIGSKDDGASKSASRNGSVASGEMSVEELRRYVMENIPQAVREQIPEDAWAQIFNTPSIKTKSSLGSGATPISHSPGPKPSRTSVGALPRREDGRDHFLLESSSNGWTFDAPTDPSRRWDDVPVPQTSSTLFRNMCLATLLCCFCHGFGGDILDGPDPSRLSLLHLKTSS